MSASLVGSEMCIRDRTCRRRRAAGTARAGPCTPSVAGRAQGKCREGGTVSYTHLTLPTICSV
eukprot:3754043-Alexandrium_andersonii.AAC.1